METTQEPLPTTPVPKQSGLYTSPDDGLPIEGEHSIDGDGNIAVTEVDASMQVMEDGDYPEDEEFE